jgi:hypothetical protein
LYEGDEEDYGSQNVGEKPLLIDDGVLIEEECSTGSGLLQKIRGQEGKPLKDFEAGVSLKDKEGNSLLEEETDDDRSPMNMSSSRSDVVPTMLPIKPTMGPGSDCERLTRNQTGRQQGQGRK